MFGDLPQGGRQVAYMLPHYLFQRGLNAEDTFQNLVKMDKFETFLTNKNLVQVKKIHSGFVLLIENGRGELLSYPLFKDLCFSIGMLNAKRTFGLLMDFLEKWFFTERLAGLLTGYYQKYAFIPVINERELVGILSDAVFDDGHRDKRDLLLNKATLSIVDSIFCEDDETKELPSERFKRERNEVLLKNDDELLSKFYNEFRFSEGMDRTNANINADKLVEIGYEFFKKGDSLAKGVYVYGDDPAPNVYAFFSELDDIRIITKTVFTNDEDFYKFSDEGMEYLRNDEYITSWCHDRNTTVEEMVEKYYKEVQKIIAENNQEE